MTGFYCGVLHLENLKEQTTQHLNRVGPLPLVLGIRPAFYDIPTKTLFYIRLLEITILGKLYFVIYEYDDEREKK